MEKKVFNDKSVRPVDWSNKKLKEEYKSLHESVTSGLECYSKNDMTLFGLVSEELMTRGYEVNEKSSITFTRH